MCLGSVCNLAVLSTCFTVAKAFPDRSAPCTRLTRLSSAQLLRQRGPFSIQRGSMESSRHPHQQCQPSRQPHHDSRLLLELPAPALGRVLQLASTPASPAICRVSCVSKGLWAAADAVAAMMDVRASCKPDGNRAGLAAWLRRYSWTLYQLEVVRAKGCGTDDLLSADDLLEAMADNPAAAAAAAGTSTGGALVPGGMPPAQEGMGQAAPAHPLRRLSLWNVLLGARLFTAVGYFSQVQELVLSGGFGSDPGDHAHIQQQLFAALARLHQLRRFALSTFPFKVWVPSNALLLSLPPTLQALEVCVYSREPCSRSSLAHLVHLTSLHLGGWAYIDVKDDVTPSPQQQQQQQQQPLPEGLQRLGLGGGGQVQEVASAAAQQGGDGLMYLSMRPMVDPELGGTAFWFTPASLVALELILLDDDTRPSLAPLAACPQLRSLRLQYTEESLPRDPGVSALTQLTGLRLQVLGQGRNAINGRVGRAVAGLSQLQQLELSVPDVVRMRPDAWQLHALQKLVVLASLHDTVDAHVTSRPPDWQPRIVDRITGWRQECSSRSSNRQHGTSSGSSSGGGASAAPNMRWSLQHLEFRAVGMSHSLPRPRDRRRPEDRLRHYQEVTGVLRLAATSMAAAMPWLEVTCGGGDGNSSPCWTAEEVVP